MCKITVVSSKFGIVNLAFSFNLVKFLDFLIGFIHLLSHKVLKVIEVLYCLSVIIFCLFNLLKEHFFSFSLLMDNMDLGSNLFVKIISDFPKTVDLIIVLFESHHLVVFLFFGFFSILLSMDINFAFLVHDSILLVCHFPLIKSFFVK